MIDRGVPAMTTISAAARLGLWLGLLLAVMVAMMNPSRVGAIELCGQESRELMRSVGIAEDKVVALCKRAAQARHRLTLGLGETKDALGYCRVKLVLVNLSTEALDSLVLTVDQARFEPFRFAAVAPGGTGYASANSRILLACDELQALKLTFHWPPSLRIGGRVLEGRQLLYYRPQLLHSALAWNR